MSYNENNKTFTATEEFMVSGSSFVEEFAYDQDSKELLVCLDSGRGYLYKGVPESTFTNFKTAHSKGQFYNNWIKRGGFGPAVEVAWDTEVIVTPTAPSATTSTTFVLNPAVTEANTSTTFSLNLPSALSDKKDALSYTVSFTVEGGNNVKTYDVLAVSVDDAVDSLSEALNALDLDFVVKGVYVSFE